MLKAYKISHPSEILSFIVPNYYTVTQKICRPTQNYKNHDTLHTNALQSLACHNVPHQALAQKT